MTSSMTSSMTLTEKESFDNYLSHKDELEYKLLLKMGSDDLEAVDLTVINELYTMDLINYEFYMSQCETIKTVHKYNDNKTSSLACLFEFALFISLIIGLVLVLSKHTFTGFPTNAFPINAFPTNAFINLSFMDEL